MIKYCNASSFFLFETVRLKNYINILSIIATMLPLASRCRCHCHCWRLVVVVDVSDSAPHCQSRHCWRLVVVTVLLLSAATYFLVAVSVGFCALSLLSLSLGLLLSAASCCCCCCRLLVFGVVVIGCLIVGGVSLLSSS